MTGEVLGHAASVATLLGLPVAVWQAWQARVAAEAGRSAAELTARRFSDLQLHTLLPSLRAAEDGLRAARLTDDAAAALDALARWRRLSGDVRALITQRGGLGHGLGRSFSRCAALADDAERALVRGGTTVDEAVDQLLRDMGDLSMRLSEVSARIVLEVPDAPRR